jgi:septal ring factor EnvC (AmiA/AmiB activator)
MQRVFIELDESRQEARTLAEHTQQLGQQLASLEAMLNDRMKLAAANAAGQQRGYDLGLHMARNGSSVDEIISASGVTRPEALLLTRLHNPRTG